MAIDQTDGFLQAGKAFEKNKVIFYEKPLAFSPKTNHYCNVCHKFVGNKYYPCYMCTQGTFCSRTCLECVYNTHSGGLQGIPHMVLCKYGKLIRDELGPVAFMTAQMLASIQIEEALELQSLGKEKRRFVEDLIRTYANKQGSNEQDVRPQATVAYYNFISASFDRTTMMSVSKDILLASVRLAFFLKNISDSCGQAVEPSRPQMGKLICLVYHTFNTIFQNEYGRQMLRNKSGDIGYGVGSFGARLPYSCTANVYRRYNAARGTISYVAKQQIAAGKPLSVWSGIPTDVVPAVRRNLLKAQFQWICKPNTCTLCFVDDYQKQGGGGGPAASRTVVEPFRDREKRKSAAGH